MAAVVPDQYIVPLSQIGVNERNYNKHPQAQILRIAASLKRFGQRKPIVVQALHPEQLPKKNSVAKLSGVQFGIIAGEGTFLAFQYLESQEPGEWGVIWIAVAPSDWDEATATGYLIADNKTTIGAEEDTGSLASLLQKQREQGHSLESLGFTSEMYGKLSSSLQSQEEKGQQEKPEIEFTEQLLESMNYVVLFFDNDIDWQHLQELFPLPTVKGIFERPGFEHQGVGRVIRGVDFLRKILRQDDADS